MNLRRADFPKIIRVETTNGCNAKCVICPHSAMERQIINMRADLFKRIVEEIRQEGLDTIHLHNFGEPLLDKNLEERVALCREIGIRRVKIFSNGSLLNERRARGLIEAGLDEIMISFDGANKEEFERIRYPLKYDVVIKNVMRLVDLRNEMKSPMRIGVGCATTSDKDETMHALEDYVDRFSFGRLHNWSDWDDPEVSDAHISRGIRQPCSRVWRTFTILSNGKVALCCLDYEGKIELGDLNEPGTTIKSIWNSARYHEIREYHRTGQQAKIPNCANCSKAYLHIGDSH
ncbi:radical SAM protein [Nitratireductor mangrovi]|uniref:Radical SAM protein n=1 Tax=Nitratireductor mangrovi TaxID=2599600 RepID=A0A5B8KWK7_9HYPH|nr:radical SAM/SPASM domain-containing protein [Nitratireductor mangrovi]QDY99972.2 radical SAM protein [Nitratireductor mangrovi]